MLSIDSCTMPCLHPCSYAYLLALMFLIDRKQYEQVGLGGNSSLGCLQWCHLCRKCPCNMGPLALLQWPIRPHPWPAASVYFLHMLSFFPDCHQ